jgi:hypothetical protein
MTSPLFRRQHVKRDFVVKVLEYFKRHKFYIAENNITPYLPCNAKKKFDTFRRPNFTAYLYCQYMTLLIEASGDSVNMLVACQLGMIQRHLEGHMTE